MKCCWMIVIPRSMKTAWSHNKLRSSFQTNLKMSLTSPSRYCCRATSRQQQAEPKLVKLLLTVEPSLIRLIESAQKFNHLLRLVNKDNNFAEKIIDTKFLKFIVNLFKKHPMNNFLHNAISQLLIDVINNDKVTETICSKESGLIQFII